VYEERLRENVAREQARKDLPLSTYTEAYWKTDLHNLFHFLRLRMDAHAQLEIRAYAEVIGREVVARWCPVAWEAFLDYRFGALTLSRLESLIVGAVAANRPADAVEAADAAGLLARAESGLRPNRERAEVEGKLRQLGLAVPWV
jgi:thymidylate synthase (FAD)